MGYAIGNQVGLGVKTHINFGNIKVFAQILDKLTTFFICNLEKSEQKICYNINGETGGVFREGELILKPRESKELSLRDATEIIAGWAIFQGAGAYAIKAQFELGLDFGNPPPPPVGVQATPLFQKWVAGWNEGTVTPGLAIVNGGSWDTDCTSLVFDANGDVVQEKSFLLNSRHRISSFNSGIWTEVPVEGGFQGWLCIVCDQRVGMMSLDAVTARQQELIGTPLLGQDFILDDDSKIKPGSFNFLVDRGLF